MMHIIPRKEGDSIFTLEEKILEKGMLEKIKGALQSKIDSLFGVSTQMKLVEEESDGVDKVEDVEEPDESEEPEQEENDTEDSETDDDEQDEDTNNEGPEDDEEDTSLDDIANLFK